MLQDVLAVLEGASADPLGPHGSPQSRIDRLDRRLTEGLSAATRVTGPVLDALMRLIPPSVRAVLGVPRWPRVPISPRRPAPEQQTPLKLSVISSLAKGADQIVARAVCDLVRQPELRNRYLEAVLPFPVALYEADFPDESDLQAFRALLALDRGRLNTHPEPTVLFPKLAESGPSREDAYAAAGRYVVDASELIVGVWDPTRENKRGGTGETLQYALDRGRVVLWLDPAHLEAGWRMLRASSTRAAVTRTSRPAAQLSAHVTTERLPSRAKSLSANFHRLAAYNRDGAIDEAAFRDALEAHARELWHAGGACGLPAPALQVLVEAVLPHVVRADHLSARYRELRDFSARLWPAAAAFAVTLMTFQILFLPSQYWLAVVELGVLLVGYVSYRVSLYEAWHEKWLNDRRLAEGLRSSMYASLVRTIEDEPAPGPPSTVISAAAGRVEHPLPFYSPTNAWFVASLKRLLAKERRRFSLHLSDGAVRQAVARFLREAWIRDQADYHASQVETRARLVQGSKRLRLSMLVAMALVAALHAAGVGHVDHDIGVSFRRLDLWIALLTVALPAWTAAFHVMLSLDDHERLSERSARMAPLLRGLAEELGRVEGVGQLGALVVEAERILDLESAEWAESLVDRRPEFTG